MRGRVGIEEWKQVRERRLEEVRVQGVRPAVEVQVEMVLW